MNWRESIEEAARKHDGYAGMRRGGAPESRALQYAVRRLKDEAADDLSRELTADCDPPALARTQAWLSLLTAYLVNEDSLLPSMTSDELVAVERRER